MLVEILELKYPGRRNIVVLFKCNWYDTEKGLRVHPRHGLVEIQHKSRLSTDEPFILAQQAQQVYYMSYPSRSKERKDWWVACKTRARSRVEIFLAAVTDDDMIPQEGYYQEDEIHTPILLDDDEIQEDGDDEEGEEDEDVDVDEDEDEDEDEDKDEDGTRTKTRTRTRTKTRMRTKTRNEKFNRMNIQYLILNFKMFSLILYTDFTCFYSKSGSYLANYSNSI